MQKRALDEPGYYAFASVVGAQRHFNVQTARLLASYGLDPLSVLDGMGRPAPPDLPSDEIMEWIIEESGCAMTMLRAFVEVGGDELPDVTPWGVISRGLCSTTEASLRRWGDVNHFTPGLLRRYCRSDGTPLDVQAMNLTEGAGVHVTEQDIWSFILAHQKGQHTYRPQTYGHRLAAAFHHVTGFRLTFEYAAQLLQLINAKNTAPLDEAPF
ncbi:hypothetical protein LJY25_08160 [Hymenobacter sp. BT175]|uniref:hypothetical protein n=1 Tax=Hymenobacter translucens TaxID=2886507 RepID=UPI001D0DE31C|nr:hypothetical protein [Hymenobacter translucens]MCC2546415.1 hypothetical protein [Hymenobacter translucens]